MSNYYGCTATHHEFHCMSQFFQTRSTRKPWTTDKWCPSCKAKDWASEIHRKYEETDPRTGKIKVRNLRSASSGSADPSPSPKGNGGNEAA